MASIKMRKRGDGGTSYRVEWIIGGGRGVAGSQWASDTFPSLSQAQAFKAAVEAAEHQWPRCPKTGVVWTKGKGFLSPEQAAATVSFQAVSEAFFAWDWEEHVEALKSKSASQWERDKSVYERVLLPEFSKAESFIAIEATDVAAWRNKHLRKYSPKTFKNHHAVLSSIMKHGALRMRLRPDNPCQATTMPRIISDKDVRFFRREEWAIFRECLHPSVHLMMDTALSTGARWGEYTALRKRDCEVEGAGDKTVVHLHLTRAWKDRGKSDTDPIWWNEFETKTWKLGPPKNGRDRWVSMSGQVAVDFAAALEDLQPEDFVFVTTYGHPWRYPDFHTDHWAPALKKAKELGLEKHVTTHMLRHTMVVWALAEGLPIELISEKLGHASIQLTYDKYGGIINVKDPRIAQAMAQALLEAKKVVPLHPNTTEPVAEEPSGSLNHRQAARERLARRKRAS